MRVSSVLVAAAAALLAAAAAAACQPSAPRTAPPSEEPFKLTEEKPLPDVPDDAAAANLPTPIDTPQPVDADASVVTLVPLGPNDGGPPSECTKGKVLPADFDITATSAKADLDGGAMSGSGGEIHLTLTNRAGVPRTLQVTEIDRLRSASASSRTWETVLPLTLRRVYLDDGGNPLDDMKLNLLPHATVKIVVEYDGDDTPRTNVGKRALRTHVLLDDKHACLDALSAKRPR